MIEPIVVSGPSLYPVTLAEARDHCRIDVEDPSQDALLLSYVAAATEFVEWLTGRTIHEKTLRWTIQQWPWATRVVLPRATPLIEIVSVTLKDFEETETTWTPSDYIADTDSYPGALVLKYGVSWPIFTPSPVSPVAIEYRAGIATASPATEASDLIKLAVRELVGGYFENRESEAIPDHAASATIAFKYGVTTLLDRLKLDYAF